MSDSRLDSQGLSEQVHCFRNSIGLVQDVTQINFCHPAAGITRNSRPVKCLDVGVHSALLPGQDEQYSAEHQGNCRFQPILPTFLSRGQQSNAACERNDDSEAREVLPVIGYE